jgi:hypothetical protein
MKSRRLLLVLLFISSAGIVSSQNIKRVDANTANGAPYTTLQAAHDAASAGDTIHLAGAASGYGSANITKPVIIIGPGILLGENPETQVVKSSARMLAAIAFKAGSNGSVIMGVFFDFTGNNILLDGGIGNIVIKRNQFRGQVQFNTAVNSALSNITIAQNYFATFPFSTSFSQTNNNILLLNNFIGGTINGLNSSSLTIKNNVITTADPSFTSTSSQVVANSTIQNNIIRITNVSPANNLGSNNSFTNNITNVSAAIHGTADGNQAAVDLTTVFDVDPAAALPAGKSTDGRWKLKAGSPAIGAGSAGEDCGMFGGIDPYVLSGLPPIPAIYEIAAPSTASQSGGLNVTIKAKAHQ